jgi:hypothetical protein
MIHFGARIESRHSNFKKKTTSDGQATSMFAMAFAQKLGFPLPIMRTSRFSAYLPLTSALFREIWTPWGWQNRMIPSIFCCFFDGRVFLNYLYLR